MHVGVISLIFLSRQLKDPPNQPRIRRILAMPFFSSSLRDLIIIFDNNANIQQHALKEDT